MSDQSSADGSTPPESPVGGFDWLIESHQQSAPMAPLTDDIPSPVPPVFTPPASTAPPFPFGSAQMPPVQSPVQSPPVQTPPVQAVPTQAPPSFGAPPQFGAPPHYAASAPVAPPPPLLPPQSAAVPPPFAAGPAPTLLSAAPPPAPISNAMPMPATVQAPPPARPAQTAAAVPDSSVGPALATAPPPVAPGFPLRFTDTPETRPTSTPEPGGAASGNLPPFGTGPFGSESFAAEPFAAEAFGAEPFGTGPFGTGPLAPTSFGAEGVGALRLERRQAAPRSGNGPLDWAAFVLAFLAPPVGLLLGIGVTIFDARNKGYVASIAKAAIAIGAVLSLVLGVALVVNAKISGDQAAHNAIVASARSYCSKLKANPATLTSDTFGWPPPGDTVPDSLPAMQAYEKTWKALVKLAPAGVLADTQKIETTAASIASSVQSTQTLDDASNVAQMQNAVAETGIKNWVSEYCT